MIIFNQRFDLYHNDRTTLLIENLLHRFAQLFGAENARRRVLQTFRKRGVSQRTAGASMLA